MDSICKTCGYKFENIIPNRCPRCGTVLLTPSKCGDCKGCGIKGKNCSEGIKNQKQS